MVVLILLLAMSVANVSAVEKPSVKDTEIRLTASDPAVNAQFGRSVAMEGNLIAVGQGGDGATGAVYVFKRQGKSYTEEIKLVAQDATRGAEFGRIVALQEDLLFIGARFAQADSVSNAGAVYVYRNVKGSWVFQQKIVSPNPASGDNFGRALAVKGDLLVVTARKEKLTDADTGAAYVFVNKGGTWTYQTKLTAADASAGAYFGQSVDVKGNLIAVGARNADPNGAGAVYIFKNTKNVWNQIAKVTPEYGRVDDQYGFTLAISGNTLAVGARRADLGESKPNAGIVYIYTVKGKSVDYETFLTGGDGSAGEEFGQSLAFAGDVLAVGAWKNSSENKANHGAVYLFRRSGNKWNEIKKITASDAVAGDEFGYSLAAAGNRMVVGAHFADADATADAGAVYVISLKP